MNVYTIIIERISTGERSPSMIVRAENESAARSTAEAGIAASPTPDDLRVFTVTVRR